MFFKEEEMFDLEIHEFFHITRPRIFLKKIIIQSTIYWVNYASKRVEEEM